MVKNSNGLYEAFKAKDPRFDGRFFVGISSTGIYCRPICKAKQAKEENCTFYSTAAEAESAGYRPCLLCRPELAPGNSSADAAVNLARKAARMLEEDCGSGQSIEDLAKELGCSDRHLRRVFTEEYNVSPVQYLQTCRLLLSKNLLTDTDLSVIDVAMASGFGSLRRFNDLFKNRYKLSPTALRKEVKESKEKVEDITIAVGYHPPYRWEKMLDFLSQRKVNGVEKVEDGKYFRTVRLSTVEGKEVYGWIAVGHLEKKNALSVTISATLLPVLTQVLARVRHLFDLYSDPNVIYENLEVMNEVKPDLCVLGTRLPGAFNAFEMAVRAVLGQQISIKAASTLAGRIVEKFGKPVDTGVEGLNYVFPTPQEIYALGEDISSHLGPLGVISRRSKTIYELAKGLVNEEINFGSSANPIDEMEKLLKISGIGSWTAKYIAMRAMEWPDAFLETDAGIKNAFEGYKPKELLEMSEAWKPWRSYATVNIWNAFY